METNLDIETLSIIAGGSFALVGIVVMLYALSSARASRLARRLREFVEERFDRQSGGLETRLYIPTQELKGSLFSRTIVPAFERVVSFFGRFTPESSINKLNHQLAIAGNPFRMRAREFYGLRLVLVIIGAIAAFAIGLGGSEGPSMDAILMGVLVFILTLVAPSFWLRGKVKEAQDTVRRALPDALDMLSVCAAAGLGFDQSLLRVSEFWNNNLALEFKRVVQEMEVGVSRSDALRNLSNRLDVSELSSFIAVIIQAETLGMRIADVLHSQAEQMRILRQYRAKEMANTLPAKMMIPLALLILPALIAVILGPLVPTFIESMGNL